jgi:hypothetical protein
MPQGVRAIIALCVAAYLLYRSFPGALLFIFPGLMRQRPEEQPPVEDPAPIQQIAQALSALGFARLGVRREIFPLGSSTLSYDFVNANEKTYASVYLVDRKRFRLYFFTPYDGGAAVLTADHKRPGAVLDGYYLAGGLNKASPEQLWAAHKRQMVAMEDTGRDRIAKNDLEDRIACARTWFTGVGKREVRVRNLTSLFMATISLFVIYVSLASLPLGRWADVLVKK